MTDQPRVCVNCGVPEHCWKDSKGRDQVNLNPLTTQCVNCLIAYAKETRDTLAVQPDLTFDARAAAARNDE